MKGQKYVVTNETNQTMMRFDTSIDVIKVKTYKEYWRRSLRKIKLMNIIEFAQRANGPPSQHQTERDVPSQQKEKKILLKNIIFLPHSSEYLFWFSIVLFFLTYFTTYGIYYTSFEGDNSESVQILIESIGDIVFILDIFVTANLAVFNDKFKLVFDRKKIFIRYLKGNLCFDLVACVPTGLIVKLLSSQLYSKFYLFRHVFKMFKWLSARKKLDNYSIIRKFDYIVIRYKKIIDGIKVFLSFMFMVHIFGCIFYLCARFNSFDSNTWVFKAGILDSSTTYKYCTSIYLSITTIATVGYGEIHPYTVIEKEYAMILMCLASILVALSASKFTTFMNNLLKNDLLMEENIQIAHTFCSVAKIPMKIKWSLTRYMRAQRIVTQEFNISKVLHTLDLALQHEIANDIYENAIKKIDFFIGKSEVFISRFTFILHFVKYEKDEIIWKQNSSTNGIYFIISGRVKYLHDDCVFFNYHDGGFFGDLEIFLKCERKFEVRTCSLCKLFRLPTSALKQLKENYPCYYKELKNMQPIRQHNLFRSLAEMEVVRNFKFSLNSVNKSQILDLQATFNKTILSKPKDLIDLQLEEIQKSLKSIKSTKTRVKSLLRTLANIS